MAPGLVLLLLLAPARAAEVACQAGPTKPLVAKPPKGSGHSFTEDKDSPYKYSELRYAHEKLTVDGVGVSIEHFGCEAWQGGERRRYSISFKLPADSHAETDAGYWLKKASTLLKSTGVCARKDELPRDWCFQLRLGAAMKPEYKTGRTPDEQGYSISFGFEADGGEEVLRVLVDRRPDRAVLRVANVLSRAKPAD